MDLLSKILSQIESATGVFNHRSVFNSANISNFHEKIFEYKNLNFDFMKKIRRCGSGTLIFQGAPYFYKLFKLTFGVDFDLLNEESWLKLTGISLALYFSSFPKSKSSTSLANKRLIEEAET